VHFGAAMFLTEYSMAPGELAKAFEIRGFESVWASKHSHIPTSRRTSFSTGGRASEEILRSNGPLRRVDGCRCCDQDIENRDGSLPRRDPIQTAKLVASLDQASGERFLFGIGGGWNLEEMADHGTEFRSRFKLMRERVVAMKEI
jgi:Luciferase-like monooxygenase